MCGPPGNQGEEVGGPTEVLGGGQPVPEPTSAGVFRQEGEGGELQVDLDDGMGAESW